jgi:hypothetical protein
LNWLIKDINSTSNTLTLTTTTEKLDKYPKLHKLRTKAVIKETMPTHYSKSRYEKVTADPFSSKKGNVYSLINVNLDLTCIKIIPKSDSKFPLFIINVKAPVFPPKAPRFSALI